MIIQKLLGKFAVFFRVNNYYGRKRRMKRENYICIQGRTTWHCGGYEIFN